MGFIKGSPQAKAAGVKAAETRKLNKKCKDIRTVFATPEKDKFRDHIVDLMYLHQCAWGNILSLETSDYKFNKSIDASHIHFQRDKNEYIQMIKKLPSDTKVIFGDINEFPDKCHIPIHAVWLDTMQSFDTQVNMIENILYSPQVRYNCMVFAFTVSARTSSHTKFRRSEQIDRILNTCKQLFEDRDGWVQEPLITYKGHSVMYNFIFTREPVNPIETPRSIRDPYYEIKWKQYNKFKMKNDDCVVSNEHYKDLYERMTGYEDNIKFDKNGHILYRYKHYGDHIRYHNVEILESLVKNKEISYADNLRDTDINEFKQFAKYYTDYNHNEKIIAKQTKTKCECCNQYLSIENRKFKLVCNESIFDTFGWKILSPNNEKISIQT